MSVPAPSLDRPALDAAVSASGQTSSLHHDPIPYPLSTGSLVQFAHQPQLLAAALGTFLTDPIESPAQLSAITHIRSLLRNQSLAEDSEADGNQAYTWAAINGSAIDISAIYEHLDILFFKGQLSQYIIYAPRDDLVQRRGIWAETLFLPHTDKYQGLYEVQISFDTFSSAAAHTPTQKRCAAISNLLHQMSHAFFLIFAHASIRAPPQSCRVCNETLSETLGATGHGPIWKQTARLIGHKLEEWIPEFGVPGFAMGSDPLFTTSDLRICSVPAMGWKNGLSVERSGGDINLDSAFDPVTFASEPLKEALTLAAPVERQSFLIVDETREVVRSAAAGERGGDGYGGPSVEQSFSLAYRPSASAPAVQGQSGGSEAPGGQMNLAFRPSKRWFGGR